MEFKQSKKWDCKFSLQRLIENNKTCIIDRKSHKFTGPLVYLKVPNSIDYYTQIGILEDGFYYRADCIIKENEISAIGDICNTKDALEEMYLYRAYVSKRVNNIDNKIKQEPSKKEKMLKEMEKAIKEQKNFAVKVKVIGCTEPEIIINPYQNLKSKIEYYDKAYNDDCQLIANNEIEILYFGIVSNYYLFH